jgi:hydrogenase maturation protease
LARSLLLGMGNPIVGDDAIGVRLAREIARRLGPRPGLEVVEECSVGGLALLDFVVGFERVVVIDAIRTRGGRAGDWHRLSVADLAPTRNLTSVHDVNFATALELGRRLGLPVAADTAVQVLAVEVERVDEFSETMSPALEAAFPGLAAALTEQVEQWLGGAGAP